jgi:hypothetical protein
VLLNFTQENALRGEFTDTTVVDIDGNTVLLVLSDPLSGKSEFYTSTSTDFYFNSNLKARTRDILTIMRTLCTHQVRLGTATVFL